MNDSMKNFEHLRNRANAEKVIYSQNKVYLDF